jgi:hypothetical protein
MTAKPWYQSKVIWFNLLSGLVLLSGTTEFTSVFPEQYKEEFALFVVVVNMILRVISTGTVVTGSAESARKFVGTTLIALSVFMTGCALRGKPPERQIAVYAIQVNDGLRAVGNTAKELQLSKVITLQQYDKVLAQLEKAFEQSSRLADALAAYDLAANETTASQVKAALDALAVLVPSVVAGVAGPGGEKIAALVAEVNKLVVTIAQNVAVKTSKVMPPNPPTPSMFLPQYVAIEGSN